jgi:hypothetical protein
VTLPNQRKEPRKAAAPWTYIECLASENRVLPIAVDPRKALPEQVPQVVRTIGTPRGKVFRGIACDHKGHADFMGARNMLTKSLA